MLQVSDYLVTEPYGGVEQEDFLNGALSLETFLSPEELLDVLHEIEAAADRRREVRWGPRTLDLDILLYDDVVLDLPQLTADRSLETASAAGPHRGINGGKTAAEYLTKPWPVG